MNDQVQARLAKLDKFKEMGVEAYPHKFNRTHDSKVLKENKDALMVTTLCNFTRLSNWTLAPL